MLVERIEGATIKEVRYVSSLEYLVSCIGKLARKLFTPKRKKIEKKLQDAALKLDPSKIKIPKTHFTKTYTTFSGSDIRMFTMETGTLDKIINAPWPSYEIIKELKMNTVGSPQGIS